MGFSKLNFIVPLNNGDKVLKIRNAEGVTAHIIRESTATTKTSSKYVYLKQSGESNVITLDFMDATEATEALVLLRTALDLLGVNLGVNNSGNTGSGWDSNNSHTSDCDCNDCGSNRHPVLLNDIWSESNLIPNTAPLVSTSIVQVLQNIPLTNIAGTKKFSAIQFIDIIPPYFGDGTSYGILVKTYNGFTIPSNLYKIDIDCGIITFPNFINVGNILVDATHPPKVNFFKYLGHKGLTSTNTIISYDSKFQNPTTTTVDGQNSGISGLLDKPEGTIEVQVNGKRVTLGNGCNAVTFYNPTFSCLFAKKYIIASSTSTSVSLTDASGFLTGDYVILVDNTNIITCLQISSMSGNTLNFLISTPNTYTQVYKAKLWAEINIGDELLWFGSYASYELDPTDVISYTYLSK